LKCAAQTTKKARLVCRASCCFGLYWLRLGDNIPTPETRHGLGIVTLIFNCTDNNLVHQAQ